MWYEVGTVIINPSRLVIIIVIFIVINYYYGDGFVVIVRFIIMCL